MPKVVEIPLDVATIVRNVFLPLNSNKMRGAHPETVRCAHEFKRLVAEAQLYEGHANGVDAAARNLLNLLDNSPSGPLVNQDGEHPWWFAAAIAQLRASLENR